MDDVSCPVPNQGVQEAHSAFVYASRIPAGEGCYRGPANDCKDEASRAGDGMAGPLDQLPVGHPDRLRFLTQAEDVLYGQTPEEQALDLEGLFEEVALAVPPIPA